MVSGVNRALGRKREQRVLVMVIIMVVCYLLCWLPYGIMALLATFGPPGLVTPEASIIPSVFAKTSTVINPIIYIFMNKQFYRCFLAMLKCEVPERGSSFKSTSRVNRQSKRVLRRTNDNHLTLVLASMGPATSTLPNQAEGGPPSSDNSKPAKVSLVAHYTE
ncbi:hypothetical protein ACEWY4_007124 [Coilia grayii]|uniref:G-protein coupled receptors family 1 profile domain-containing protein n=1 Tax=Coilia grayii TaxID=363190 RepID=A0ABD1KFK5_9TELE